MRLGLREMARKLDLGAAYLSELERGVRKPPPATTVERIAAQLGLDPEQLVALATVDRSTEELDLQRYGSQHRQMAAAFLHRWNAGDMDEDTAEEILGVLRRRKRRGVPKDE
jgi:transcriptional regulator with XRE-family HTH domain